ncbi:MAG: aminodeoxychorismate synthase component I, partial [Cytophagales bacterium]|nr:aminodeoxychorismate synthase component I [Rhizobacter sp.]
GSPQDVWARIGAHDGTVLLESSKAMPGLSGWSWVGGAALATLETRDATTTLREAGTGRVLDTWADPFDAIQAVLSRIAMARSERPDGLAFAGGLIGFLGYDLARFVERLPVLAADDPPLPTLRLHLCDHVLAFDHAHTQWYFCTLPCALVDAHERAQVWAATLALAQQPVSAGAVFRAGPMVSRTPAATYLRQVREVLGFIAAGDIFQANLSHRLEGPFEGDAFALYRALTAHNPAPFAAYMPGDGFAIASVSPERFLKLEAGEVTARPIKGTLPRDADPLRDAQQRAALQASVKDRAENLMIVDLMRNDLGRVAQVGSVRVDALFEPEAHPSVWQLVSTVRARLRAGATVADLLRACWPPGSMTGAPKVRAMEIIESMEPVRRGPYAGAIGYFDAAGDMDLSVVIRTAVVHGDRVMVQLGGAVVADSDPQQELAETEAKGRLLLQAMQG